MAANCDCASDHFMGTFFVPGFNIRIVGHRPGKTMKRIVLTGLIVMFVAIAAAVALPFIISSETVRSALLERAREITGREMRFSGDPSVLLNPFLGIEIRDVTFHDSYSDADAKPILSMPTRSFCALRTAISSTSTRSFCTLGRSF